MVLLMTVAVVVVVVEKLNELPAIVKLEVYVCSL